MRDGAPRDDGWLAAYTGDPGTGTCGVPPTESELKSAHAPFALQKITCTNYGGNAATGGGEATAGMCTKDPSWAPPILGGNEKGGGHRRLEAERLAAERAAAEALDSKSRRLQAMGINEKTAKKAAKKSHVGLTSFDTDACSMDTIQVNWCLVNPPVNHGPVPGW
jgi:hypothetical protein